MYTLDLIRRHFGSCFIAQIFVRQQSHPRYSINSHDGYAQYTKPFTRGHTSQWCRFPQTTPLHWAALQNFTRFHATSHPTFGTWLHLPTLLEPPYLSILVLRLHLPSHLPPGICGPGWSYPMATPHVDLQSSAAPFGQSTCRTMPNHQLPIQPCRQLGRSWTTCIQSPCTSHTSTQRGPPLVWTTRRLRMPSTLPNQLRHRITSCTSSTIHHTWTVEQSPLQQRHPITSNIRPWAIRSPYHHSHTATPQIHHTKTQPLTDTCETRTPTPTTTTCARHRQRHHTTSTQCRTTFILQPSPLSNSQQDWPQSSTTATTCPLHSTHRVSDTTPFSWHQSIRWRQRWTRTSIRTPTDQPPSAQGSATTANRLPTTPSTSHTGQHPELPAESNHRWRQQLLHRRNPSTIHATSLPFSTRRTISNQQPSHNMATP